MTVTIPYEFSPEYCSYRLPCGICERTNKMCPLQKSGYKVDYTRPTTTTTTGTGSITFNQTVRGLKENESDTNSR